MSEQELDHLSYCAVEKALTDLRTCYEARLREYEKKSNLIDQAIVTTLRYVIDTLDLHLELAKLKFELWDRNIAKTYETQLRR